MEYYQYFRLKGSPFQPASPKSAVYFSPTHLEALATLEAGLVGELTGLTLLTGEAGTGKTTLIYALLQRDYKRVRIAHVEDPKLSFLEMLQVIMPQLNLYASGTTKLDYLRTIDHLLDLHGQDERIAIIIDESQVVSDEVLDELRLLSNRGQRNDRRLQLILVGQPELAEKLKKPELRQLNQRISSRGVLKQLTVRQALMYVDCMLSAQGGKAANLFERGALECLLRVSDGIPRKVNMLCHTAMLAAYHGGERKISLRTAKKTAQEYQESVGLKKPRSIWRIASVVGATAAALIVLAVWKPLRRSSSLETSGSLRSKVAQTVERDGRRVQRVRPASAVHEAAHVAATSQLADAPTVTHPAAAADAAASSVEPETHAAVSAGVANPVQKASAPAEPDRRNQVIVRYGDTLQKIAIRYFGSDAGVNQLIEANPQLTNINQLGVGQVIYLPRGISARLRGQSDDRSSASDQSSAGDQSSARDQSSPDDQSSAASRASSDDSVAPAARSAP